MSDNHTTDGSEQSNDLFAYIGGTEFQAVENDELVEQLSSETPVESAEPGVEQNVDQAAADAGAPQGVTPPQMHGQSDEALRFQQRINQLEHEKSQREIALALIAGQAKTREEQLFNRTLELMTPEEQVQAKEARRIEQLEAENLLLRTGDDRRRASEEATQERLDKAEVVQKVVQRLGLPMDDMLVMQALMESQSPAELFATANRMARAVRAERQATQQQFARSATQGNVHAAGGETAPATAPKRTPQRKGELVDMMRERQYTTQAVG